MKTQEELIALKKEYEALNAKLKELTEEELKEVTGGMRTGGDIYIGWFSKSNDKGEEFNMTKEELTALKKEYEEFNNKLKELTEEELKVVIGGFIPPYPPSAPANKDRDLIKENTETVLR